MELHVLLDPGITLQDWPEPPVRVTLLRHKHLTLCSLLPQGGLHLTVFTSGAPQGLHAHLDGPFIQFLWEDGNGSEVLLDRNPRLLTLSQDNEFCVHDVCVADGRVDLIRACVCDKGCLRQLCAEKHVCIPSLPSVRLLSLCGQELILLVSNCFLVHLHYNKEDQKPKVVSCLCLELDSEAAERISDVCLSHEILFLLDSLGTIYAFDILDGSPLIVLELPVRTDSDALEPLNCIRASPNLDLMVVSSGSSYFLPLKLSKSFSEDATLCLRMWRGQHRLCSTPSNVAELYSGDSYGYGFQMDRSWDAILSSFCKETKSCSAFPVCPSTQSPVPSTISTDAPLSLAVSGAGWVKLHTDNMKNPVRVHSWSLSSFSALFCLSDVDGYSTLVHWNMETQAVEYHALGKALCVDGADEEACLIITDKGLSLALFAVSQNEFLTRLMIHGSASTADTLCYLNNWGRCSVPIHTLEAGLENRQLDTVDFFLKSKESILTPLTSEDGSVQSQQYLHNVQDLVPALDLLYAYIQDTNQEPQSKHFSEQLLQLTLHFLNGQVVTLCNLLSEPDPSLEQCVGILSGYINKLRSFMRRFHLQPFLVQAQHAERGKRAWESMPVENIISDAILSNCIPEAQSFLRGKGHHCFSLQHIKREGMNMVFQCLIEKKVTEACQLLQNMGYSVWDELRRICLYTSNVAVRDLLIDLLQQKELFSVEEQERIHTVYQLEKLCNDVRKHAGERLNWTYSKPAWKTGDLPPEAQMLQNALSSVKNEPIVILLHWTQDWDFETRESILLPWKNDADLSSVSPKILWRHLTLWHDWPRIESWIDSMGHCEMTGDSQNSQWPPLTTDIIEDNMLCCDYTRERILNKLARMNIFIPSELNDFESLVQRLVVNGQLMLPADSAIESICAHYPDFNNRFVLMCVERGLQHLLYAYLDHHSLQPENCSALSNTSLHEAYPWFGFMVNIRQVSADTKDGSQMFHSSLSNAHVLMPGYQPSVNGMLLEGHTLLALATSMYAAGGIDGVLQQSEETSLCTWNVDPPLLKMALAPYPKLKAALFPQHPCNTPPPPDITLYHLLQSLPPFHPSKFFTWQPTNPFAAGDNITELPHFSCPRLVNKYAIQEKLDIFFYLRSGRPSMAFYNFILNQLLRSKNPQQLIKQTAEDVYVLALSSFSVSSIISSCVCFLELLGVSSHKLRVDVSVANIILKHTISNLEEAAHKSHTQELAQRLLKLVDNEIEAAKDLLVSLEEAVAVDLEKEDSNSFNGLWVTAVKFCHLHSIPASVLHLRHFAQKQDWLQLLVHANSQEQIFNVLNELSPVLGSHFALALQSDVSSDCTIQETDMETNQNTVHHVLQKCLSTEEPGKMLLNESVNHNVPLFSVLATCTENTDIISCMCAWIVTSVNAATHLEITQMLSTPEDHKWKLEDLTQIWNIVLGRKDSRTLRKAFTIFMEDCPLLLLLEMFELCMEYKDYSEAKQRILEFQKKLEELQSVDDGSTLPLPVVWLHTQASHLLRVLILQSQTSYEVQKVLQLLCDTACQPLCEDMDLQKLRVLAEIIEDQPFSIRKELLSDYSPAALQEECQRLLQILLDEGQYSLAHQVAKLAELPTDNLVIEEVLQNRRLMQELGQWECPQSRAQYWRKCHEIFTTNNLAPLMASSFFRSQASLHKAPTALMAERIESLAEQELLLTLAGHWLSRDDNTPVMTLEELEQQIWNCRIEQEIVDRSGGLRLLPTLSTFASLITDFSFSAIPVLNTPLLLDIATLPPLKNTTQDVMDSSRILSSLVDRLLDESKVHEASRVCRYFQLSHLDVWIVLSCRALASEEMSIHQLHPDIQTILAEGIAAQENLWSRRKRLQSSSSVESPATRSPTDPVLMNLEILKGACKHGKTFCRQLLCMYELSQEMSCSFLEVSSRDPSEVLRTVLSKNRPELADTAQAVISSHGLAPETVAQIVAEECLKLWRTLEDMEGGQAEIYNVSEKRANFLQFAKLCPDPTLVGLNLLEYLETVPLTELQAIIEVLISAHDCFSLTCHLEGIRRVLHVCRHLTEMHLAPKQEYSLMVRLLSGIGRYNDMVYVFDILHKNQHFELLLRKQLDTKGGLQTALLEYIKRCHPGDSEKHNMTALCFSLHRDIGHNHEHAAKIQLRLIQSQPWEYWISELEELKSSIMKALTLLIDAAESYSKDSCVRQSLRCARLTRLLTLQLHLLKSGHKTRLINLDRESLMEPILALPRFYQAVIVSEAYDIQPDWAEVLYNKVVLGGDFQYLEELKQRQLLSKGVFEQISSKCKLNPPGVTGLQNLKRVICYCEDINLRYNLAIENNFYEITDVLMRDSQTRCCLTDMLSQ